MLWLQHNNRGGKRMKTVNELQVWHDEPNCIRAFRQAAIEWIKEISKTTELCMICQTDGCEQHNFDVKFNDSCGGCSGTGTGAIMILKHFFDITTA